MKYPICCITDEDYAQHCGVMLCSLFENNKGKSFVIHILIPNLCNNTKEKLSKIIQSYGAESVFHQVDESKLKGVQFRKKLPKYAAYFKLIMSSVIDRGTTTILYLDSDVVVNGDITHIFDLDISEYALAAVEDIPIEYDHRMQLSLPYTARYFNSGVMLVNLEYWRKNESEEKLLRFAKRERTVYFHDQDALNVVFRYRWFPLHPVWNRFSMYPYYLCFPRFSSWKDEFLFRKYPLIIHYASYLKPWYKAPFIPYRNVYCKYLELTPWKDCQEWYKPSREILLHLTVYILHRMRLYFILRLRSVSVVSKHKKSIHV